MKGEQDMLENTLDGVTIDGWVMYTSSVTSKVYTPRPWEEEDYRGHPRLRRTYCASAKECAEALIRYAHSTRHRWCFGSVDEAVAEAAREGDVDKCAAAIEAVAIEARNNLHETLTRKIVVFEQGGDYTEDGNPRLNWQRPGWAIPVGSCLLAIANRDGFAVESGQWFTAEEVGVFAEEQSGYRTG